MIIHVTRRDITAGEVGSGTGCPVSHAIRRATGASPCVVGRDYLHLGRGGRYRTPLSVRRFIRQFDGGDPVSPFGFRLAAS
jgi:hypothetical protein